MTEDSFKDLNLSEVAGMELAARDLVTALHLTLKMAAVHDQSNDALQKPIRQLCAVIGRLLGISNEWLLRSVHEHLFINQTRLRLDNDNFTQYVSLLDEFKQRGVGSITFSRTPTQEEAIRFVYLFLGHRGPKQIDRLSSRLQESGLDFIQVDSEREILIKSPEVLKEHAREVARETFFGAIFMTGGLLNSVEQQRVVNIRRARRVIQSFLDLLSIDEDYLLGMTSIKNYDDYTFNHSVNVTVLALNLGRALGFSRLQLTDLGLSAIFHDLGKISLPRELVSKQSQLDENEWQRMHLHPVEGVKKLLRLKGITELTVKLIISVYEHHMNFDYTGYPKQPLAAEASLFSRILRIVDSFDAMTSKRAYTRVPKHPVQALEEIWNLAGRNFDPDLVKVFINMIGPYPMGTIVQLASGEIGMVVAQRRNTPRGTVPVIRVLADWQDSSGTGKVIDLSQEGHPAIVGYYNFGQAKVDPSWYLLAMGEESYQ